MLIFLFFLVLFFTLYSYFIYPVVLIMLKGLGKPYQLENDKDQYPTVTIIVTCYNEAARVKEKIQNTLEIDYPEDKLEVIFASDCSDDGTDDIIKNHDASGIRLVRSSERLGKENAQLTAIREASHDILVFSDVATQIPADSITKLVQYYSLPEIGAVSSEDRFIAQDGKVAGEGMYVKYEMWLRQQESMLAGLVGLSGSFFSCRKEVASDWDIHSPSDFNTAINAVKHGLKAVTAPDVLGYYKDLSDPKKEYQRKIRTVIRGITGFFRHTEILNIGRYRLFSFQILSHKLMRWLVPFFMLALLLLNLLLLEQHIFFLVFLILQLIFYSVALFAHFIPTLRENGLIRIVYFFVQVNIAIFHAFILYLTGKRMTVWQPSKR